MYYIPIFLFIVLFEILRKKNQRIDSVSIFGFTYLIGYVMTLMLWGLVPEEFSNLPYRLNYNASEKPEVIAVSYISYFTFLIFYYFMSSVRFDFLIKLKLIKKSHKNLDKKVLFISCFFALIVIFNIAYTGGVAEYIFAGNEARHNKVSFGLAGYFNYFLSASLLVLILVSFVCIKTKSHIIKAMAFGVVILLFLGMLSRGGRGGIVFTIIYVLMYFYYVGFIDVKLKNFAIVMSSSILILFIIYYMRAITNNVMLGNEFFNGISIEDFFSSFSKIVIYPFKYAVHKVFTISEFYSNPDIYNYPRLGVDIVSGFALIFPGMTGQSLGLPVLPDIISQSVMGLDRGYIPPGWVGWSLMDGGMPFLILKICWSAFFSVFLDKSSHHIANDYIGKAVYFILILFLNDILFGSTSMNLFRGNIGDFFLLLLLFYVPFIRIGKLKLVTTR